MDYSKHDLDGLFHLYVISKEEALKEGIENEIKRRGYTATEIYQSKSKVFGFYLDRVKHRGLETKEWLGVFLLPFKKFERKNLDVEIQLQEFDNGRWDENEIPDIKLAKVMGWVFYILLGLLIYALVF